VDLLKVPERNLTAPTDEHTVGGSAREKNDKEKASEGVGMFSFFLGCQKTATKESKLDRQEESDANTEELPAMRTIRSGACPYIGF
jgi:hypothetical protein